MHELNWRNVNAWVEQYFSALNALDVLFWLSDCWDCDRVSTVSMMLQASFSTSSTIYPELWEAQLKLLLLRCALSSSPLNCRVNIMNLIWAFTARSSAWSGERRRETKSDKITITASSKDGARNLWMIKIKCSTLEGSNFCRLPARARLPLSHTISHGTECPRGMRSFVLFYYALFMPSHNMEASLDRLQP